MGIIAEIKWRVKMRDVLESYGIYPTRGTNIYHCIYHCDEHPSAHISKSDRFVCFSGKCAVNKDIIDIVRDQEQCDLNTAFKIIDDKFKLGLMGNLTKEQRLEIERADKDRKRAEMEKNWWVEFERKTYIKIADRLKLWEQIATDCHLTRGEYRSGNWELADLYFHALKQHELLSWLYDTLNGHENYNSNYTYFIGTDRQEILKSIAKGEI